MIYAPVPLENRHGSASRCGNTKMRSCIQCYGLCGPHPYHLQRFSPTGGEIDEFLVLYSWQGVQGNCRWTNIQSRPNSRKLGSPLSHTPDAQGPIISGWYLGVEGYKRSTSQDFAIFCAAPGMMQASAVLSMFWSCMTTHHSSVAVHPAIRDKESGSHGQFVAHIIELRREFVHRSTIV